jgi:hypothetical protein
VIQSSVHETSLASVVARPRWTLQILKAAPTSRELQAFVWKFSVPWTSEGTPSAVTDTGALELKDSRALFFFVRFVTARRAARGPATVGVSVPRYSKVMVPVSSMDTGGRKRGVAIVTRGPAIGVGFRPGTSGANPSDHHERDPVRNPLHVASTQPSAG